MSDFMLQEIQEQPAILSSLLKRKDFFNEFSNNFNEIKRVILTGSGDSHCAAIGGKYGFSYLLEDISSFAIRPMELTFYRQDLINARTLVVGISVSGKTPRVLEALKCAKAKGALVAGLTDNLNSPIADLAGDLTIVTGTSPPEALTQTDYQTAEAAQYTGYHHDIAQTKTYIANIFSLLLFATTWSQSKQALDILAELPKAVTSVVEGSIAENIRETAEISATRGKSPIMVGSGPNRANALFGSYKGNEFTISPGIQEIEEYCHTQYFVTEEGTPVIFLAPAGPSLERTLEITPVLSDILHAEPLIFTSPPPSQALPSKTIALPSSGPDYLSTPVYAAAVGLWWYYWAKTRGFDTNKFRGGVDTERYVAGSLKTIRKSQIQCPE
ncbi:MAG: SIS domain-containing protein [Candidatus Hodarchaeales archaeon]|jgi:glucosamine--fructose-6-phosphate aminotransferase (isomerizing)